MSGGTPSLVQDLGFLNAVPISEEETLTGFWNGSQLMEPTDVGHVEYSSPKLIAVSHQASLLLFPSVWKSAAAQGLWTQQSSVISLGEGQASFCRSLQIS